MSFNVFHSTRLQDKFSTSNYIFNLYLLAKLKLVSYLILYLLPAVGSLQKSRDWSRWMLPSRHSPWTTAYSRDRSYHRSITAHWLVRILSWNRYIFICPVTCAWTRLYLHPCNICSFCRNAIRFVKFHQLENLGNFPNQEKSCKTQWIWVEHKEFV